MMDFNEFLVEAKRNTYAGGRARKIDLKEKGNLFVYEKESFQYRDKYYGYDPFGGQEVVSKNGKIIWIMNYYGMILCQEISSKDVYNFLRRSMSRISVDRPFRGPENFKEKDFEYKNEFEGDISDFRGIEVIYYKDKKIYSLTYHGGFVK